MPLAVDNFWGLWTTSRIRTDSVDIACGWPVGQTRGHGGLAQMAFFRQLVFRDNSAGCPHGGGGQSRACDSRNRELSTLSTPLLLRLDSYLLQRVKTRTVKEIRQRCDNSVPLGDESRVVSEWPAQDRPLPGDVRDSVPAAIILARIRIRRGGSAGQVCCGRIHGSTMRAWSGALGRSILILPYNGLA